MLAYHIESCARPNCLDDRQSFPSTSLNLRHLCVYERSVPEALQYMEVVRINPTHELQPSNVILDKFKG